MCWSKAKPITGSGKKLRKGEWFSCPLVTFLSLNGKIKGMFVSSAMLTCQQWWIQSTGMRNSKGSQTLFISTTIICWELINQTKCCCITLHCKKTVRWYKKVGIYIMEIFLSNTYYMYAKNTANPITKNMKDFRESIVINLIGPPPPNRHLNPQASFHHLSTAPPTKKKNNAARTCKHCSKNQKHQ